MISVDDIDCNRLHCLQIVPLSLFIGLRLYLLVPFELIVGKEWLVIRHRYRARIPGQALVASELVYAGEVREYGKSTSCESDVLIHLQAHSVLKIVRTYILQTTVIRVLKQGKRTIEVHYVSIKIKRRESASLIRPISPIGGYECLSCLQCLDRLMPRSMNSLIKAHLILSRQSRQSQHQGQ